MLPLFFFFSFFLSSGYQEKQERKKAMAIGRRALGVAYLAPLCGLGGDLEESGTNTRLLGLRNLGD